ncbi:MAG: tetratricopeptide repeat protein, partial [Desulfobacteraceae bacterium]
IIEGAKELGRRYEHAKWVVSYYPFGCKCCYFSPRFASLTPVSTECLQIKPLIGCSFFMDPTEVVLYDHLFEKGGFDSWVELQINPECFRVVEGEVLGTFEEVYCTLLLDHLRDGIESFKNREFGAAYQFLKEALALKEDQEVYLYMAYTEMILDEEANLEKTLAESLSLKEDNEVYRQVYREYPEAAEIAPYREGLLLYELNRPDEAQTAVREYLRKYPRGKDAPWGPMRQKI